MAFKLTLARVANKGALALRLGILAGQKGNPPGRADQLYVAGETVSFIGAALPPRLLDWLKSEGLSGASLEALYQCGHIDAAPHELPALYALEALDAARRDHIRRQTGHAPALELALAGFAFHGELGAALEAVA
jgi:hypothetical protein